MSAISRTYTFTDGTDAYGSQVENEFNTIYNAWNNHDAGTSIWTSLKAALLTMSGNIVMASNKITGLAAGTAAGNSVRFEQLKYIQEVSATTVTSTATTSSTYQSTALTATITPSSASNRIKITVTGGIQCPAVVTTEGVITVFRDSTDTEGSGTGLARLRNSSAANIVRAPAGFVVMDSPASTSAIVYTVKIKSNDNTNSVAFVSGSTEQATIVLEEVV